MTHWMVLFDIDGTLLKTNGAGMRAMQRAGARLFGDGFSLEGVQVSGHLDPLIFAEAASILGCDDAIQHHDTFHDHYIAQLEQELFRQPGAARTMPGIDRTLGLLRERRDTHQDLTIGLLTGNYSRAVPIKLTAAGIDPDWFQITAFGDEGASRPALVEVALSKYEAFTGRPADPGCVIVVGDTPRDVACAQAHGCVAFAVATGPYDTDALHQAGADHVVEDLSDPNALLDLLNR